MEQHVWIGNFSQMCFGRRVLRYAPECRASSLTGDIGAVFRNFMASRCGGPAAAHDWERPYRRRLAVDLA